MSNDNKYVFYKDHFDVLIDDLDFTSTYTNAIYLNKLSNTGSFTINVNSYTLDWINSLRKMQPAYMKYLIRSPDNYCSNIVYEGRIFITDLVYECDKHDSNELVANIKFEFSDKKIIND